MSDRTAFVTGATGFLGLHLVEQLRRRDWHVVALRRRTSDTRLLDRMGAEQVVGDITDIDSLRRGIPVGCDAVFHAAALTSIWKKQAEEQEAVNVGGTRNVIRAALDNGVGRVLHTSTWNVFDWSGGEITEDTPKGGDTVWIDYNRTKLAAEEAVLDAVGSQGLDAVILNPSHIIGRYDRHNWARLISMAAMGRLPGVPPGAGDFAHGPAVAAAHVAAFEKGGRGRNYLLGGPHARFLDLVRLIARHARQEKVPKRTVPPFLLKAMGHFEEKLAAITGWTPEVTPEAAEMVSRRVTIVSTRARDELGYAPTPLDEAVEDAYVFLMREKLITS
ncbi:MAG: hypothetical protein TEF_11450 [Rhizobiales bacterium NRL2]|jgi:nucleoside-diphosphate-sugar epimerase|nr:MAG: hypothetical protein TEF_11450 [Rhizobiales bacterium NRL2]